MIRLFSLVLNCSLIGFFCSLLSFFIILVSFLKKWRSALNGHADGQSDLQRSLRALKSSFSTSDCRERRDQLRSSLLRVRGRAEDPGQPLLHRPARQELRHCRRWVDNSCNFPMTHASLSVGLSLTHVSRSVGLSVIITITCSYRSSCSSCLNFLTGFSKKIFLSCSGG